MIDEAERLRIAPQKREPIIKISEEVGGVRVPLQPGDLPKGSAVRDFVEHSDLTGEDLEIARRN